MYISEYVSLFIDMYRRIYMYPFNPLYVSFGIQAFTNNIHYAYMYTNKQTSALTQPHTHLQTYIQVFIRPIFIQKINPNIRIQFQT